MAEIQRSSRRRVFMVSVLKTKLNSSHFTHIQEQIPPSLSFLQTANPRAAKHHPLLFNEWRETWWMTMKEEAREAFWACRSKVFQAYQGTCYVMSHISLLQKWMRMNTWGWICTAHPTVEGGKNRLEISGGDYCQGQDRCQRREEIKRGSFQKMWAGLLLATIPLFFFILSLSCIFLLGISSVLFYSPSFIG